MQLIRRLFFYFTLVLLSACSRVEPVAFFEKGAFPDRLSDWNLFHLSEVELRPAAQVIPYDLKSALFTDYAHKLRTVYVPGDAAPASQLENGVFELPVGAILSKTFYYSKTEAGLLKTASDADNYSASGLRLGKVRLIETRLLVHTSSGWIGLPYVWNEAGTEAVLEVTGSQLSLAFTDSGDEFSYAVPDFNQCQGCHIENLSAGNMAPVGFKAHHLDKAYAHMHQASNQLEYLASAGVIASTKVEVSGLVDWQDEVHSIEDRARSYLDINCGHCHNDQGPADTSGMFLTRTTEQAIRLGVCKPPVAAGQGTGGRPVGIHPGEAGQSILPYRMASQDLGAMMPELGRSLVHSEGVALVERWIEQMEGDC